MTDAAEVTETSKTPGARDDTRSRSQSAPAQDGAAGDSSARNTFPRAAGATPTRGAQPPGRRVMICQLCRRRIVQMRNGEWYHRRNASAFCRPGEGTGRKAVPLEIEVTPAASEHRVVETETLNYHTGSQRLTCSCGWEGHRNRWADPGHGADIPPLPQAPGPPRMSPGERRAAIWGDRRRRYG